MSVIIPGDLRSTGLENGKLFYGFIVSSQIRALAIT